jgi:MFS family permease
VLLPPVAREFGWARGTVSSAIVVGLWMTGIATPLVGRLVDRYGIRPVALPAIALFSAATAQLMLASFAFALLLASGVMLGLGSYVYRSGSQGSRNERGRRAAASPAVP